MDPGFDVRPIGWVSSPLTDPEQAPRQADEGAPQASITFVPEVAPAVADLAVGDEVLLLTWLHLAARDVLAVHPREDPARPLTGVFSTRSQDRPNPIGLHRVRITDVAGLTIDVDHLEALDCTPVLDVKPVLGPDR